MRYGLQLSGGRHSGDEITRGSHVFIIIYNTSALLYYRGAAASYVSVCTCVVFYDLTTQDTVSTHCLNLYWFSIRPNGLEISTQILIILRNFSMLLFHFFTAATKGSFQMPTEQSVTIGSLSLSYHECRRTTPCVVRYRRKRGQVIRHAIDTKL